MTGKRHSEETKKKISNSLKRYWEQIPNEEENKSLIESLDEE